MLFIDEIHRFSKAQQDSVLGAVETGKVTLIGAPSKFVMHTQTQNRNKSRDAIFDIRKRFGG